MIVTASPRAAVIGASLKDTIRAYSSIPHAQARAVFYAKNLRSVFDADTDGVIRASQDLGTAAGTLVVQRSLDLLKYEFPVLSRITTDFSAEQTAYGQTVTTRTLSAPAVGTYHTTNGYVSGEKVDADVPLTINAHKFGQFEFNANEMSSTRRLLFGESEPALHYTIGEDLVSAIYALITTAYTSKVTEAANDVDRATIIEMARVATDTNKMPLGGRTLLLNSTACAKLAEDQVVVSNFYNAGAGNAITTGKLPPVHGWEIIETPNLPATDNLQGFGFTRGALCVATRLPGDYAGFLPDDARGGSVEVVTNPDTGLSVQLVKFANHQLGKAYIRVAWMYGVARGQILEGVRLVTS